jgi:hypothetical protein
MAVHASHAGEHAQGGVLVQRVVEGGEGAEAGAAGGAGAEVVVGGEGGVEDVEEGVVRVGARFGCGGVP